MSGKYFKNFLNLFETVRERNLKLDMAVTLET